jgi:hypothetical protein
MSGGAPNATAAFENAIAVVIVAVSSTISAESNSARSAARSSASMPFGSTIRASANRIVSFHRSERSLVAKSSSMWSTWASDRPASRAPTKRRFLQIPQPVRRALRSRPTSLVG